MAGIDPIKSLYAYMAQVQPIKPQNNRQSSPVEGVSSGETSTKAVQPAFGQLTGGETRPTQASQYAGLAFSPNLQNVNAGEYKGKENILNQIAIA